MCLPLPKGREGNMSDQARALPDMSVRDALRSPATIFYTYDVDNGALLRASADLIQALDRDVAWSASHVKERERVWAERERVALAEVERLTARVTELEEDPRMALDHVDLQLASEACGELAKGKWIWRSPAAEAAFGVIAARLRFCVQYHHPPAALAAEEGDE